MSTVEQHYDAIRQKTKRQRFESPAIRLFRANNAVKRILYDQHGPPAGGIHFEMGCGKGGDMGKAGALLRKAGTLIAIDVSLNSIIEAKRRLQEAGPDMPLCHFIRDDMTSPLLWRTLDKHLDKNRVLPGTVDSVSCHFALHYAWDTRNHAQMAFWNAAARLKPGGTFVCTIVDWPGLVTRMAGRPRIGNEFTPFPCQNQAWSRKLTNLWRGRTFSASLIRLLDATNTAFRMASFAPLPKKLALPSNAKPYRFPIFWPETA